MKIVTSVLALIITGGPIAFWPTGMTGDDWQAGQTGGEEKGQESKTDPTPGKQLQVVEVPRLQLVQPGDPVLKSVPKVTEDQPMDFWMKHKLDYSKKILEAMTLADFEQVQFNSQQMRLLSRIEGFVRRSNADYTAQAKVFDNSLKALMKGAEQQDNEQILRAFGKMTTSCVKCHTLLRGESQ